MEVIHGKHKENYLDILKSLVNIDLISRDNHVNIFNEGFTMVSEYDFGEVGEKEFYEKYINKKGDGKFVIIPLEDSYPAFLFDNNRDSFQDYSEIINYPKLENMGKHIEHALTIICEVFFILDIENKWCIYSNRYFDTTQVAVKS